ncbi:MAG: sulfatase-like hydrolase/transferase [Candidatus Latescibacterota bacterium]|nr:sulfatase-like hydrolase/transferase [Candidatus Latescibacterota bacterium]
MPRPNLLLLITDQQRWDAMGCASDWVHTPHLDRLAAEGTRFRNCVTNSPVCIPARLSLATGLYPHNTWVWDNQNHTLDPEQPTWMQAVRAAGYRTSLFGKTHLHPHSGDLRDRESLMHAYGLDDVDEIGGPRASARVLSHMTARWQDLGLSERYRQDVAERFANKPHVARPSPLPLEEYADCYVGRRACEYLQTYDRSEPWCCWVSFGGPHEPWDTPEPYASQYDPDAMPSAVPRPVWADDPSLPRGVLHERLAKAPRIEEGDVGAMRANYAGNVSLIDEQIGAILGVIEARGALDNTAVVFTSDHGEMNGDYGLIYKSNFLNGAARVPMLVRMPPAGNSSPGVNDAPVEWIDVGPTLVELAGGTIDYPQFGRSLLPLTVDPQVSHRTEAMCELEGEVMILDERWKAAVNRQGELYLLFDQREDPYELTNLAGSGDHQSVASEMRKRILQRLVSTQMRQR